jgi:outer membrane lipoprotein-sorting protein
MGNFSRTGFIAIALTFIFSSFAVNEVSAQRVSEVLRRMDVRYKNMQTLQADIVLEKYSQQIDETDRSSGKIKYIPKTSKNVMYIRIDWMQPVEERMAVIGDEYRIYRPKLKQVYEGKTSSAKNNAKAGSALAFLSMSRKELVDNFTHRDLGDETIAGGTKAVHLELTPKNAATYKLAHLWVDKDGVPVMARIVEKNDDSTTILISNLKLNATLDGKDFVIDYPKSIKPIR